MSDPRLGLARERAEDLLSLINRAAALSENVVVVLDDDPTGTQTVFQTPVLTTWETPELVEQLRRPDRMFFLLTNSRALPRDAAIERAGQIGANLKAASEQTGRNMDVISRSDSTLRGHYPHEVDSLAAAIGCAESVQIIMPFFLQGGRLTIDDIHYVVENGRCIPASQTAFANDATFGFRNSNLLDWIVEKHEGAIDRSLLHSISIDELRRGDLEQLAQRLLSLPAGSVVVVNAAAISDARAFAFVARRAKTLGARLIYRTAASFVQAYAGLDERPLLNADQMIQSKHRSGLIVVGSYVPKTTLQLNRLLDLPSPPRLVVIEVDSLLHGDSSGSVHAATEEVNALLNRGQDVVLSTSRGLVTGNDGESSLRIGSVVSDAVVDVVRGIDVPLRFLIAKGGITSSDVATKSLQAKRALVLGQILPGVPVWSLGNQSRSPELPFVVFPGNVGDEDALRMAYEKLRRS